MQRKGISPLVAVIMLIAFTLIIAGILAGWATQFTQSQRTSAQRCVDARIILQSGVYANSSESISNLTLTVYNYGSVDLSLKPIVKYVNGSIVTFNDTISVNAGEIVTHVLTGIDGANFEQVTVQSVECTPPCYYCPGAQDLLLDTNIRGLP